MCPTERDTQGEELLRDLDQLQASEALPDIEPPAMIDQAVRNMARREMQDPISPNTAKLRWVTGLATVSMAVIALGIALVQAPQAPDLADPVFKSKMDESRSKDEKTNNTLQSAPTLRTEPDDEQARQAERSAVLEVMKKAAVPVPEPAASAATSPASAPSSARLSEEIFTDSAEISLQADNHAAQARLELIQQLHEQGLTSEAVEQLRAFVKDYPDYPLPDWAVQLQRME